MDGEDGVDDLRGDIEAALGGEDPGGSLEPDDSAPSIPEGTPTGVEPPAAPPAEPRADRDSLGRFLPKTAKSGDPGLAAPPGTPGATQPGITQPAPAQAPAQAIPPPAGWGFTAREHWAQVPAAVQQEVARREQQMQQYVNQSAPARQLGENFWQTVQPFMPAIQAEGVDPVTAASNLFQFAARMRMGTPNEKATTVANICKAYGVDLQSLDSALAGQQLPAPNGNDPQVVQQAVQQALLPLYQAAQQRTQRLEEAAREHSRAELQQFGADPQHRYLEYLRPIMADLVEAAQQRGGDMSLQDAYDRASMLHPEISKVIIAQRQGANAHQLTAAAQRAKAAAVSVNGSAPIGNPNAAEPTSIRESIEAAIEAHSRY